ncbi:hypothetical protein Trydic_g2365 [Trypoxylus dichotomus]
MSDENDIDVPDRIYDTYLGGTFFISGGSGFMGKTIIERLLRLLDVEKIYVLIRTKKDKPARVRLEGIFTNALFDVVRQLKGDRIFDKCIAISGDITKDNLGLSEEDREILKRDVDYVIHAAASVRFDEPLRSALLINTKGVLSMLQLAREMKSLKLFIHLSTAFCHTDQKVLKEEFYRSKHDAKKLIGLAEMFDDATVESMRSVLVADVPNTYTFTKALGEDLIADVMDSLPVVMLRPSIVVPIWKDPIPGWNDNINGPMGMMAAAGKGVLRSMYGNKDAKADFVSADVAADAVLVCSAYVLQNRNASRVYNICVGDELPVTWGGMIDLARKIAMEKVPFDLILWAPGGKMRNSRISHYFMFALCQLLPALLVDLIVPCFGYKPFLWKVQMRIIYGQSVLDYYTSHEWVFDNSQSLKARSWMNKKELTRYTVTADGFDMEKYIENGAMGMRRYLLKEPDENLPKAKRTMKIMIGVDRVCNVLLKVLLAWLFYQWILLRIWSPR